MRQLIIKSLWHFRKQHLAVFAGTVIGTAVLTGALIIGDSVNYSLRNQVEARLGKTTYILNTGGRFVRSELAHEISVCLNIPTASVLMLQGIAINPDTKVKVNSVQVIGMDDDFQRFFQKSLPALKPEEAVISENVAQILSLKPGDEFLLRVENANLIPLNTPLVRENKPSIALRITIKAIANTGNFGKFSLKRNQTAPFNVFVSRDYLSEKLELHGLANTLLISSNENPAKLDSVITKQTRLADLGLTLQDLPEIGKYELVSDRIFMDGQICKAIQTIAIPHENVLTYLVNNIRCKGKETPYSFVTAASYPIVPKDLKEDEIIVNEWLAKDLSLQKGDSVSLDYFVIGALRTLKEKSSRFMITAIIPTEGSLADRTLMPTFPGLSDAGSCRDWNSGVPIDFKKIRDKDEKYWTDYRGTPKALISIETGLKLWGNPFGDYTAIRYTKKDFASIDSLKNRILKNIQLKDIGISIVPVRSEGLSAADNSVDFGELFLSLSFFIIVAAIMLTALIYSLNTSMRSQETAILSGLGFSRNRIMFLRFTESSLVIILGGIAGAALGIIYNHTLLAGLNSVWHDAVRERILNVYIKPSTLLIGALSGIMVALVSVFTITYRKLQEPIAGLFKGSADYLVLPSKRRVAKILAGTALLGALSLVCISVITSSYENAGLFITAGGLFLVGSIMLVSLYISRSDRNPIIAAAPAISIFKLAVKNAGRNKSRSLTIILVLAIGTFIVVLTGSYRKTFYGEENKRKSGSGGFLLWTETTMPVAFNLSSSEGKKNLITEGDHDLDSIQFIQLHSLDGDDASCLNLNQVKRPRILGVNTVEFNNRGAFSFVKLLDNVNKEHPWKALDKTFNDHVIPAMADQTVIQYGLKKSMGDTLTYMDEFGETINLCLVAGLDNSIFQGNILIADSIFVSHFPSMGSKVILIDAPASKQKLISDIIGTSLSDFGVTVTSASERLAEFNSVENTYLSVFMVLGGLGLLIGTFGLGIILFRNILERRHELALLIALGFRKNKVFQLVLLENVFLLFIGLLCGSVSAMIGILPSIISPSFSIQGGFLIEMMAAILILGAGWIYLLTRLAVKGNLIEFLLAE